MRSAQVAGSGHETFPDSPWRPTVADHGGPLPGVRKRSVRLDLKARDGADRLRWLLSSADVLVENGCPGSAGVRPDALREFIPRLVVLSPTGFGLTGRETTGVRPDRRPRAA